MWIKKGERGDRVEYVCMSAVNTIGRGGLYYISPRIGLHKKQGRVPRLAGWLGT
jgi:hypothetical protein